MTLLLAGCGGSGNSSAPERALALQADRFAATTGESILLDVLANDRDPGGGALTLVSLDGGGQVQFSIENGRVRYQPPCCALATDRFRYTARSASGRIASAEVTVDITRRLRVTMRAARLPPGAFVEVGIGGESIPGATLGDDRTGTFTLDYRDGDAEVFIDAWHVPRRHLASTVGTVRAIAAQARRTGDVGPDEVAALDVSPLTTSLVGTVRSMREDRSIPTQAPEWDAAVRAISDWHGLAKRARYLDSIVDAPFSATEPSLAELAADPARTDLLAAGVPGWDFSAVLPDSALESVYTDPGDVWLYRGGPALDRLALKLEVGTDGSSRLVDRTGVKAVRVFNVGDGGITVEPIVAHETMFTAGLVARRGLTCPRPSSQFGYAFWSFELGVDRMFLDGIRIAKVGGAATALAGVTTGTRVDDFSRSSCNALITLATPMTTLAFHVETGAPRSVAPLVLTAGLWLVPYGDSHATVGVSGDGNGLGPATLPFTTTAFADGSLEVRYDGGPVTRFWAVARYGRAYRVVYERTNADGTRNVDEGWIAAADAPSGFGGRLRGARMTGCCVSGDLRPVVFDADGHASFERSDGVVEPAAIEQTPRFELRFLLDPRTPQDDLTLQAIRQIDANRFLVTSRFSADRGVDAQLITLTPL